MSPTCSPAAFLVPERPRKRGRRNATGVPFPLGGAARLLLAAVLVGTLAGCRGMLDIPESAKARGYHTEEAPDGWLFDRLTGQEDPSRPRQTDSAASGSREVELSSFEKSSPPTPPPPDFQNLGADAEQEDSGLTWSDFYPSNIVGTVKNLAGYGPNELVARAMYQEGEALYAERRYAEAAERFAVAAKRAPDDTLLQEDSLFMWGESLFFSDQYPKADEAYAELLKKYEYTRHLDKAVARQFAIGRYWEQLDAAKPGWAFGFQWGDSTRPAFDTWGRAIKSYRSVRLHDPTGRLADDSVMATANAYFLKGRYEEAAHQYDTVRKEYPKSEHQLNAHLLGMRSKLNVYQGPLYDGTPLEDASEIADQMLRQFSSELGSERQRVVETQNRIYEERAERAWTRARYYENKKRYGSARLYYQHILDEYPTTEVAQRARVRLGEIRDYPDNPPDRFKWLTDRFPSGRR